jgi:hypothetical protein
MRTIRASETGHYLYCRRSWWYQQQGIQSENLGEMTAGSSFHRTHGRTLVWTGLLNGLGWLLLLGALVLLAVGLTLALL